MSEREQRTTDDAAQHDGAMAIAIVLLAAVLIAFLISQIL